MKIKKKLRDLTKEEYSNNKDRICVSFDNCEKCPFNIVACEPTYRFSWTDNKKMFSDKFLNQEVEIEVPDILTKEDKEYLEVALKPIYESGANINRLIKYTSCVEGLEYLKCVDDASGAYFNLYFKKGTMFRNMQESNYYMLEDLGLFQEQKPKSTSESTEKKITLSEFGNSEKKLAIHCDTEEKANELLKAFDKLGKKWANGISYLDVNFWDKYKEKTCYKNSGFYGSCDYCCTVYEFDDVDLDN